MTAHLTLTSTNEELLHLAAEFAQGLGCEPKGPGDDTLQARVPDAETLLSLLTYVALSATKLHVNLAEPLCEVTYQHGAEASQVTLALRLTDIRLQKPASV